MLLIHIHVHGEATAHLIDRLCTAVQAGLCPRSGSKEKENKLDESHIMDKKYLEPFCTTNLTHE